MKFRQHKELLEDSMATLYEFETRRQLLAHVNRLLIEGTGTYNLIHNRDMIVKPYVYDARIGWDCHLVTVRNVELRPGQRLFGDMGSDYFGAMGYTDGPVEASVNPNGIERDLAKRANTPESLKNVERQPVHEYIDAIVSTVEANVSSSTRDMAVRADFYQRMAAAFSRLAMATAAFHMGAEDAASVVARFSQSVSDCPDPVAGAVPGSDGAGSPATGHPAAGYLHYECPECEFTSVQRRDAHVPEWCPMCAADSGHHVVMRRRPAKPEDKPEGYDARMYEQLLHGSSQST